MPYICSYNFCKHEDKVIHEGEAVGCTKCMKSKTMHKDCFDEHNKEKHSGKATSKFIKETDFPGSLKA